MGLGVGINTNDRLRIGVSDEVGLEHAGTDGEVSSGLEDCVVDVSLIQDVEYTSEALLQGGVSQVFDADGDLAAGADEADEVAGQGLACGEVALAYISHSGVIRACISVGGNYRDACIQCPLYRSVKSGGVWHGGDDAMHTSLDDVLHNVHLLCNVEQAWASVAHGDFHFRVKGIDHSCGILCTLHQRNPEINSGAVGNHNKVKLLFLSRSGHSRGKDQHECE